MWMNILVNVLVHLIIFLIKKHERGAKLRPRQEERIKTALGYMKMATEISQQHFGLTPATVAVPEGNDDHDEDE